MKRYRIAWESHRDNDVQFGHLPHYMEWPETAQAWCNAVNRDGADVRHWPERVSVARAIWEAAKNWRTE